MQEKVSGFLVVKPVFHREKPELEAPSSTNHQNMNTNQLIAGHWQPGTEQEFESVNPSNGNVLWRGREASRVQVAAAYAAAREAFGPWWDTSLDNRIAICNRFAGLVKQRTDELAALISAEMGKTLWEARGEVATVVGKIAVSIDALKTRRDETRFDMNGMQAVTRFKPFGVMAVLGPFNFPAHLPNGHIVPALLAGNTIVFKPSEQTPAVGAWMASVWLDAGLPPGVLNLVQGGREVGMAVSDPNQCDGLLFTGSGGVGRALHRAFGDHPQKILALEMGGNNPLVVDAVADLPAAAYQTILSAYITAGQRCTCARRLILVNDRLDSAAFMNELKSMIQRITVGLPTDEPEPFYGPVINQRSGQSIKNSFDALVAKGARVLAEMKTLGGNLALLSPGLLEIDRNLELEDEEVFGPLLTVYQASDLNDAIELANSTRYGLSAGLLSDDADSYRKFIHRIRAGIVNWNRQTTGASGKLPFGGCGQSGNHRPAGYYAADYCSFPVASLETQTLALPTKLETGIK